MIARLDRLWTSTRVAPPPEGGGAPNWFGSSSGPPRGRAGAPMSDRLKVALPIEPMGDRTTPVTFGEARLDRHPLPRSFAPEGTQIGGVGSSLAGFFSSYGASDGRLEMLKAFQVWVAQANLNVGLVTDLGQSFETAGAVQGDPRFGDIRIGGRALAADVVALTNPSGPWNSSAGDIVVNTQKAFEPGASGGAATHHLRATQHH